MCHFRFLKDVFERSFYEVDEGDDYIRIQAYNKVYLSIDDERFLLTFESYREIYVDDDKIDFNEDDKIKNIVEINDNIILAKTVVDKDGDPCTRYQMNYRCGITESQIVTHMRLFDSVTRTIMDDLKASVM